VERQNRLERMLNIALLISSGNHNGDRRPRNLECRLDIGELADAAVRQQNQSQTRCDRDKRDG